MSAFCRGLSPPKDARASLRFVADALRRHGLDAYSFQVHHPALDELGYATARVVVPGLVPMYCEERSAPLGLPRLRADVGGGDARDPRAAATEAEDAGPDRWPPWPHPFP